MFGYVYRSTSGELANKNDPIVIQSRNVMHGWPSIQRRGKWLSRRIVYSLLTNCSQMSLSGSYSETWYFMVLEQTFSCGCKQYTSHVTFFSCLRALVMMCRTTLAQVFVRVIPYMCHAPEWLSVLSSISILHSSQSLSSPTSSSWSLTSTFCSSVWVSSEQDPLCIFALWGVWPFGQQHPSHRLWAQLLQWFPLLRDNWNLLPGAIQRHGALALVWRGTRRRDHRWSALFTTVHSGARRTSEPKTSLSLSWRRFVATSVLVCVSFKKGRPVHEFSSLSSRSREKPSRDSKKRANQDSPWTTKRANSRWL